ncbi:MAG: hypothetical protein ACI4NM_06680 [Bullifex sp.]
MVCVYGLAVSNGVSALSLVRSIRKSEPRVSLIAALSDDERGLSVIDTLIAETVLFDPAAIFPGEVTPQDENDVSQSAARLLDSALIREILDSYSDIKAFVFSPESLKDEFLFSEGMKALSSLPVRPVMVSCGFSGDDAFDLEICETVPAETSVDKACIILSEGVLRKGGSEIKLPGVTDYSSALSFLSQREAFGSVLEKPSLFLSRL